MLHGTIRNDDFQRNTALQCQNSVATLCCAKNRPCESSRPFNPFRAYSTSLSLQTTVGELERDKISSSLVYALQKT